MGSISANGRGYLAGQLKKLDASFSPQRDSQLHACILFAAACNPIQLKGLEKLVLSWLFWQLKVLWFMCQCNTWLGQIEYNILPYNIYIYIYSIPWIKEPRSQYIYLHVRTHMGQILQDGENGCFMFNIWGRKSRRLLWPNQKILTTSVDLCWLIVNSACRKNLIWPK